ncbi:hypothetical protein ACF1BP_24290 [Streptomyces sp. NPDC014735]|uniref:hypothetical protein n=1 Tax=Streptomyces sp. NPDC014735 TaxID=3364887 RepID=UPI003700F613
MDTTLLATTTMFPSRRTVLVFVRTSVMAAARSLPGWSVGKGSRAKAEKPEVEGAVITKLLLLG